jgi:hypothetical protein
MQAGELYYTTEQDLENASRGKILLIDDDTKALEARSASLRREGHEVRAYASFPEGLSRLESEHFDLIMVKLEEIQSVEKEEFWSVSSRSTAGGPSSFWHAASIGLVTWMWRTWEVWSN